MLILPLENLAVYTAMPKKRQAMPSRLLVIFMRHEFVEDKYDLFCALPCTAAIQNYAYMA